LSPFSSFASVYFRFAFVLFLPEEEIKQKNKGEKKAFVSFLPKEETNRKKVSRYFLPLFLVYLLLISCSFTPRRGLFLVFSSSGRKKPKEETKAKNGGRK
jgi:hypothetical protein